MLLSTRSCVPLKLYEDFFFRWKKLPVVTKIGNLRGIMTKLEFFSFFLQQSKELHEKTWLQNIILRKN